MINRIVSIFAVFFILFSCNEDRPLTFSSEEFNQNKLEECKGIECPEILVNYLTASGNQEVQKRINQAIEQKVIDGLNPIRIDSAVTYNSINEAAEAFLNSYKEDKAEFPDMAASYESKIDITKSRESNELVSLKSQIYGYMGGAHGFTILSYLNFDAQTGDRLENEALFINNNAFKNFAEKKFREKFDIPKEENINATGFWFKDEIFILPEAIGYEGENLVLIYNQYEIASYAEGQIILNIPIEQAMEYLAFR